MDMSISKKNPINQFEPFEKPIFVVVLVVPIVTKIEQIFARSSLVCETIILFQAPLSLRFITHVAFLLVY